MLKHCLIGLLLLTSLALADTTTVEFDVQPRAVRVGESVTCRITIKGGAGGDAPALPPISGFDYAGTSSQRSYSIGSGGQESTVSYLYQLVARSAGTFQIGPFQFQVGQQAHTLGPVEVSVVGGQGADSSATARQEDFLFARLTASLTNAYVQQPIYLELALYWRDLNLDREVGLNGFDATGLRLSGWQELGTTREIVRDQVYEVRRFRCQAVPLSAGNLTISPTMRVNVLVQQTRSRPDPFFGNSIFDDMFFGRYRAQPTTVHVDPLDMVIRDLPSDGRPPEFNGAVGRFQLQVDAQPLAAKVGEPIVMKMRVTGDGNWDTIAAPMVGADDAFRRYEPKLLQQDVSAGQKTFEQVLIPRVAASTNLPAIVLAFFDPESGRYERAVHPPIPIEVSGQAAPSHVIQTGGQIEPTTPQAMGIDIAHLKIKAPAWDRIESSQHAVPALSDTWHAIPLMAFVGAWWMARRRKQLQSDQGLARRLQAPRSARRALAAADQALAGETSTIFYEQLWAVLTSYFGNRFNLAPGEVSFETVATHLRRLGWKEDRLREIQLYFDACEGQRFGGTSNNKRPLTLEEQSAWKEKMARLVEMMKECDRTP